MAGTFRGILLEKTEGGQTASVKDIPVADLMPGDVTVEVKASTLNYKDGLALTGAAPIVRHWPMVPGIDLAGTVRSSDHPDFHPGDAVLCNGWGLSETHWGGYAELARLRGDWLVPIPDAFDARQAMAIGTAGYTAMLCVLALEDHGVRPESGPVLVTGAGGGVGSVAVALLARLGYHVVASTGRMAEETYLRDLGAREVLPRDEFSAPGRPLGSERWAGAVDVAGSHTLANVLATTKYGGAVASCGLAQGMDLPGSVAPFILRGVTLRGIDSVYAPKSRRLKAWMRLVRDLDRDKLAAMTRVIPLADVIPAAPEILAGKIRGRTVIDVAA